MLSLVLLFSGVVGTTQLLATIVALVLDASDAQTTTLACWTLFKCRSVAFWTSARPREVLVADGGTYERSLGQVFIHWWDEEELPFQRLANQLTSHTPRLAAGVPGRGHALHELHGARAGAR